MGSSGLDYLKSESVDFRQKATLYPFGSLYIGKHTRRFDFAAHGEKNGGFSTPFDAVLGGHDVMKTAIGFYRVLCLWHKDKGKGR